MGPGHPGPGDPGTVYRPGGHVPHDVSNGGRGAGGAGGAGGANYLDSTYYGNVAQNLFNTNNQLNALHLQEANGSTNLQAALARLAYRQPRDELNLEQGANRNGSLYSSVYNQNLGNLNYNYAGQRGGLISGYGQQRASLEARMAALRGGIPLYNDAQAAAAADRAAAIAAKNPASGEIGSARLAQHLAHGSSGHPTRTHPGARTGHERGGGIPSHLKNPLAGGGGGHGGATANHQMQHPAGWQGFGIHPNVGHRGGGRGRGRGGRGGIPQHYRLGL